MQSTRPRARTAARLLLLLALVLGLLPATVAEAAYPGANGPLVFERGYDIWLVQPDGTGLVNLTDTPDQQEREPVLSPDGTRVAFTRTGIYDEIWAIGTDGTGLTEVSNPLGHDVLGSAEDATWSPDGTQIAFSGFHRGQGVMALWVVDASGGGGEAITTGYTANRPDWGVTGEILIEVAGDFYAVDPASRTERVVLRYTEAPDRPYSIDDPEWSPDGTRIAFTCDSTLACTVAADGTDWTWLTQSGAGTAAAPQYSPDGQWIAFAGSSDTSSDFDVWMIPAEGEQTANRQAVTSGPATDRDVDWGPAAGVAPPPPPPGEPTNPGTPPTGPAIEPFDDDPTTTQVIARAEPVGAAIEISRARFADAPEGHAFAQAAGSAAWVVLSRDDDFPDSLAGSALTAGGPMLFTGTGALTPSTHDELRRVLPDGGRVYLLGGTNAISQDIEDLLLAEGYEVRRLQGPSRVETAIAVADEVRREFQDAGVVLLARAAGPADNPTAGWADSVSGGGIAAFGGLPILVTGSASMHPAVQAWLAADAPARTILLGGVAALSEDVAAAAPNAERVAGDDRTATAAAIAEQLWPAGDGRRFVVVNGAHAEGWAFGLAAAGVAADATAPVLLVTSQVSPATAAAVSACGQAEVDLLLVGDGSVIAPAVATELDRLDGEGCGAGEPGTGGATPPPSGGGGSAGQVGRWSAEPRSSVVQLDFTYDGAVLRDFEGYLLWYCDGSAFSTQTPWVPEADTIPVTDGSWSYEHEFSDGQGNTYREELHGSFTSATTASGTVRYEVAGNGSYCISGEIEWTATPG